MAGVESGGKDFHHDVKECADAVGAQAKGGHGDVVRVKAATVEESGDDGRREDNQADGGSAADKESPAQRPVQRAHELAVIGGGTQRAQARQDDGSEGDANQADRQFNQAVGVIEPGDAARDQPRGEIGVNQHGQLADGGAEQRRQHQFEDAAHAAVLPTPAWAQQHPAFIEKRQLQCQLRHAAQKHRPSELHAIQSFGRRAVVMPPEGGGNQGDIEQHRGQRRNAELAEGVEHAARHRRQRNQQDVGKHDAQHIAGEDELVGELAEAACHQGDNRAGK